MCIRITPASRDAASGAMPSSSRRAVISLMMVAPASSAARATAANRASIEIAGPSAPNRRVSSPMTGCVRRICSSAVTARLPGRVDSPPTSITSAPSSAMRTPASIASAATAYRPPSLNESGVTFTTPNTNGPPPGRSSRPRTVMTGLVFMTCIIKSDREGHMSDRRRQRAGAGARPGSAESGLGGRPTALIL